MEFDLWETRFASRGGIYYFLCRGEEIIPISALGKEVERDTTARGPRVRYAVELTQDDTIVQVDVGSAKATRRGQRGILQVQSASLGELEGKPQEEWHTILRNAPQPIVDAILLSPNVPPWMIKRIKSWGTWK